MTLPKKLNAKLLDRFAELIAEGEEIDKAIQVVPGDWKESFVGRQRYQEPARVIIDWPRFVKWRENASSLLDIVVLNRSIHRKSVDAFPLLECGRAQIQYGISKLTAIRDDFDRGFLGDLILEVEAELASDYLGQAECLLGEGAVGKFEYVPAAVLAGAVLERALRTICGSHTPPLPVTGQDGKALMMNRLIDSLKANGTFNELVAKQLRAWADIRNAAAHGEFDKFNRQDVVTMMTGVSNFLAIHHP